MPIRATPAQTESTPIRVIQHHSAGHPSTPPTGTFMMPFPTLEIRLEVQTDGPCLHAYLGDDHPAVTDWQIRKWFASGYQLSGIPPLNFGINQTIKLTNEKQQEDPSHTPQLKLFHQPDWWNHLIKEEVTHYPPEVFGWSRPLDNILLCQMVLIQWPEFAREILNKVKKNSTRVFGSLIHVEKLEKTCALLDPQTVINRVKNPLVDMEIWRHPTAITRKLFTPNDTKFVLLQNEMGLLKNYQTATKHNIEPGDSEILFLEILNKANIHPMCQQHLPPEWFLNHPEANIENLQFTYPVGPAPTHRQSWLKCPRQRRATIELLGKINPETVIGLNDTWFKKQIEILLKDNCIPLHWAQNPECASRILENLTIEKIQKFIKQQPALICAIEDSAQDNKKLKELLSSQI